MGSEGAASLRAIFEARSIALVGASADPTRMGGRPLAMMLSHGFDGTVHPVNPRGGQIQGVPAYRSLSEIRDAVDLVICSVGAEQVPTIVAESIEAKVKGVVVFAGGFAEADEDGRRVQTELRTLVRSSQTRLLGPNCMGFVNFRRGLIGSFHPAFERKMPKDGRIAVVTQSGAFAGMSAFMGQERGIGFSHIIATGNEVDIDVADCIQFLAEDESTSVILCYLEAVRDGARFKQALAQARRLRKPIVAVKLGSTGPGARAAQSHTAALAGNDEVYDAIFQQYGVYRARTLEEFFDIGCAAALAPLPRNRSVGIVSVSGGAGVLLADAAADRGLDVAEPPAPLQERMKELVPIAGTSNPFDITGYVVNDQHLFGQTMDLVIEGAEYASIVAYQGALYRTPETIAPHLPTWRKLRDAHPDLLLTVSGFMSAECHLVFEGMGVPAFREPTHAVRAIAALHQFAEGFSQVDEAPPPVAAIELPRKRELNEVEGLGLLAQAGIPVVPHRFAASPEEAAAAASELGYPVAVKGIADGVLHKSDLGAVRLGVQTADDLREACATVRQALQRAAPQQTFRGYVIQAMAPRGLETIIGAVRDPTFGPMIMFGLGGILVEALGDVAFRAAPFGLREAHRMMEGLKGARILDGYRGAPAVDRDAIADALVKLSSLASCSERLHSIEANPFIVFPAGKGGVAVDAVVQLGTPA